MTDLNKLGESFEASIAKDDLRDIIGELGDSLIDALSPVGESIPGVSYLFKLMKASNSLRAMFEMEKVIKYLREISTMDAADRAKVIDELNQNTKSRSEFGKHTLILLERLDHSLKAKYLASAFFYLGRKDINENLYYHFGAILERIFISDLRYITDPKKRGDFNLNSNSASVSHLQSLGLVKATYELKNLNNFLSTGNESQRSSSSVKITDREVKYTPTDVGLLFAYIVKDVPSENWYPHLRYFAKQF